MRSRLVDEVTEFHGPIAGLPSVAHLLGEDNGNAPSRLRRELGRLVNGLMGEGEKWGGL